jgi:hypothetical protein
MKLPNRREHLDNIQFYSIWVYITKYSDYVLSVLVHLHVKSLSNTIVHKDSSFTKTTSIFTIDALRKYISRIEAK